MRNLVLTLFTFLIISPITFAQGYDVEWGKIASSKGAAYDILSLGGSEFYTLRRTGSRIAPTYRITYHKDFEMQENGRIITRVNGSIAKLEGAEIIDGKLYVFLSDKVEDEMKFYMQEYRQTEDDIVPKGIAIELASYQIEKKRRGGFSLLTSRDKEFFAVEWIISGKKEDSDEYGYIVYDNEINVISEGQYKLPFDGNLSSITERYLSNTGDYFLSVSEYEAAEKKGLFRSYIDYKAMHLFHITPEGAEQYTMEMNGRRVESMTMSSDNNGVFSITGMYGEFGIGGVAGIYNITLNFFKNTIVNESFEAFTKDFITQDWSEKQKDRADKRAAKGKGEPQLYNYLMRDTETLKDGSVVGSAEQYYVEVRTYTDARGFTQTTYVYHYNDIIAFKIGKNGEFDWIKKLEKYQVSTNDGGPLSSYSRFVDGDNLVFIFNDNIDNYNESGKFEPEQYRLRAANYRKKKNAVALVKMDVETGEYTRETFFSRDELNTIAIPKMFHIDYVNSQVLMYSLMRTKERFGLINLED